MADAGGARCRTTVDGAAEQVCVFGSGIRRRRRVSQASAAVFVSPPISLPTGFCSVGMGCLEPAIVKPSPTEPFSNFKAAHAKPILAARSE